jgi:diacylglycerol kinase (ATP)
VESEFKGKSGLRRVLNAVGYSMAGIAAAWRNESAFRQETVLAAIMIPTAFWLDVSRVERAVMIGTVLLVLIVELINSSIEAVVDRVGLERHDLSKRAKDAGSAAVFVSLVFCVSVWAIILWP